MQRRKHKFLGIAFVLMVALSMLTAVSASASHGGTHRTKVGVNTHPSQGPVTPVDGAFAQLMTNDTGAWIYMQTKNLERGHAATLWVVTINRPDLCLTSPCSSEDILKRTDIVKANVSYGDGRIVRGDKTHYFSHVPAGKVDGGWFSNDFTNPRGAEIHLVVNDHGPMIPGMVREMTETYRAGCTDESIPPLFPDTARADGTPGPNQCRLVQVAIFQQ